MFFVFRKEAVLDQERNIAESVADGCIIVDKIGRNVEDDLALLKRNQLQSLAPALVVRTHPFGIRLPELIVAIFLFQTRRGWRERCHPMRLLVLSFVYAGNPVDGTTILAECYTRC
jgi:hypothetical protein